VGLKTHFTALLRQFHWLAMHARYIPALFHYYKILAIFHKIRYYVHNYVIKGLTMQVMSVAEARKSFKSVIDSVLFNNENVIIHRKAKESVVVISLDEFNAIKETEYLLSTQTNKKRLLDSIEQLESGKGIKKELMQ
jgi:antitoxin YefM